MSHKSKAAEFINESYQITVTGRNIPVTDALRDYVISKVTKIEKFSPHIIDAIVILDVQKLQQRVDILLSVDHIRINSHAISEDLYASIDKAVDKIEKQLHKYKDKLQDHHAEKLASVDMKVNVFKAPQEEELWEINQEIEEANKQDLYHRYLPDLAVSMSMPLVTMTKEAALMNIDLSQEPFRIFKDREDHKIKVIYPIKRGEYGIVTLET